MHSESQAKSTVEPEVIKANVETKSLTLEPFQIIGFSIQGKVVNSRGEGISEVKISIDGQPKT